MTDPQVPVDDYDRGLRNLDKFEDPNPITAHLVRRFMKRCTARVAMLTVPGDSVLDAGAGEGMMTSYLVGQLPDRDWSALEHDEGAVEQFRLSLPEVDMRQGSIYNVPWPDNSFDTVTCLEVLEHLGSYPVALEELRRVSRRNVVITVPYEPWFRMGNVARGRYVRHFGNTPGHVNQWSLRSLRRTLEGHFPVVEVVPLFPWLLATLSVEK